MIQPSDDDLVFGTQPGCQRTTDGECQRGHVRSEDDLVRAGCVEQIRDGPVRLFKDGIGLETGSEGAAVIGICVEKIVRHTVDNPLRHLGSPRIVEEGSVSLQSRKLGAKSIWVEAHHGLQSGAVVNRSALAMGRRSAAPQPNKLML